MKKGSKMALGAAVAAGVGFVTGILTAPRSGKQTRRKIASSALKARVEGEKQLKSLHADLQGLIKEGEDKIKNSKAKADKEFKKQLDNTKKTKQKVKLILSAIHSGEATDPDLKNMLAEAKKAKANLSKFLKK